MSLKHALKLLKPTSRFFRQVMVEKNANRVEALAKTYALEYWLRLPVLYTDGHGLNYLLYPGQNAEIYFQHQGNYEVGELKALESIIHPGMNILDVGSNIGLYSLLFAKWVGSEGSVHAFEAESRNYQKLLTNIALNPFQNIKANHLAAYSSNTVLQLNVFPESVNAWHSIGQPAMRNPWQPDEWMQPESHESVQGIRLDDYCEQTGVNRVDLLKIDVEGAELDVLKGCSRLLEQGAINQIMFEISKAQLEGMGYEAPQIFNLLSEYGYESRYIQPDGSLSSETQIVKAPYGNYIASKSPT